VAACNACAGDLPGFNPPPVPRAASPAPAVNTPVASARRISSPLPLACRTLLGVCSFAPLPAHPTLDPTDAVAAVAGFRVRVSADGSPPPMPSAMEAQLRNLGEAVASAAVRPRHAATLPASALARPMTMKATPASTLAAGRSAATAASAAPDHEPPMSPVLQQIVLGDITEREEAADHREAQQRSLVEAAGRGVAHRRSSPPRAVERPFNFAALPSLDSLKEYRLKFVSMWMLQIISTWPQTETTGKRRKINNIGIDCSRAGTTAASGTNAIMKTWQARIRTACAFANFVGEVLCVQPVTPRPSNEEIDRGVQKFFRCMTAGTHQVITLFLECRRLGYQVAGGKKRISAVTLKDNTSGLSFLFGAAKMDGHGGKKTVVEDCSGTAAPWALKGINELEAEKKVRPDAGTHIGNPMTTDDLKDFRGATHKDARHSGEHSLSSAPVTPTVMQSLHNELVVKHLPDMGVVDDAVMQSMRQTLAAPPSSDNNSTLTPASVVQADILTYIFYVFAFITLARPVSLINLMFCDISFPDLMLANEQEFFNRYDWTCLGAVLTALGCSAHRAGVQCSP